MIDILYEDNHLLVCIKEKGILSQADASGGENMVSLLKDYLKQKKEQGEIGVVHRLDRGVGGVMVYAKRSIVAAKLSQAIAERDFVKEYLAVVHNCPKEESGVYKDLLFKDSAKNKSYVVDRPRKGVKEASLEYRVLETLETNNGILSLVKIRLHTGRTHQIRVQFSSRKMPLLGDGKYGSKDNASDLALWSYRLAFKHPMKNTEIDFAQIPPACYPWNLFKFLTGDHDGT